MNYLKHTCLAALLALPLMGCVAENASVVIQGVISPITNDCTSPGNADVFMSGSTLDASIPGNAYHSWLSLRNYTTSESPWQSSGSGAGSGATFDPTVPNRGTIFINAVVFNCIEINGSAAACRGAREIRKTSAGMPVPANGVAIVPFAISFSDVADWGVTGDVTLGISVAYHDTGVIKGTSSQTVFRLVHKSFEFPECEQDISAPSDCAIPGQDGDGSNWCPKPAPPDDKKDPTDPQG